MLEIKVDPRDYKRILSMSGAAFESGRQGYFERVMRYLGHKVTRQESQFNRRARAKGRA